MNHQRTGDKFHISNPKYMYCSVLLEDNMIIQWKVDKHPRGGIENWSYYIDYHVLENMEAVSKAFNNHQLSDIMDAEMLEWRKNWKIHPNYYYDNRMPY